MDTPLPAARPRLALHRRIADKIRDHILRGDWAPGTRIPSTSQLAVDWNSSYFTVYTALQRLVKEGLIERMRGAGSYVADQRTRFTCAAIYHASDIFLAEESAFGRRIHVALLQQLKRLKVDVQVFIDSRAGEKQATVLPALTEAILHRRVQCVIGPTVNGLSLPALERLKVPTSFQTMISKNNATYFDIESFLVESARRLAAQGCQTIGVISNVLESADHPGVRRIFYDAFRRAAHAARVRTRDEWTRRPRRHTNDIEGIGYTEFKALWGLRERPEGLIVYPDVVVRGAIMAILEIGLKIVTPEMKFVFHRNAHLPVRCPFSVTWGISDEDLLAEELVGSILRQFKGEKGLVSPIPYSFVRDAS